jgi:Spy/CpxP family protein refolding chaperone
MNSLYKNKLLTWLVLVLVFVNIGSMIFIWMGKPKHESPIQGSPKEFLSRELKFDEKQQVQFEKLVVEHRNQANDIRKKIKEEREEMYGLLQNPELTDSLKNSAVEKVAEATKELDLITLNHFEKVRNMCSPQQKIRLDQIMMQMLGMMSGPQQPMRPAPQGVDSLRDSRHALAPLDSSKQRAPKRHPGAKDGQPLDHERPFHDGPPPPGDHDGPPPPGDHQGPPPRDHRGPPPPGARRGPPPSDHRFPPPPPPDHK